ncbi:IS5 family transposase [Actinophytocola glycyrrhizae]|uniref:IS5 family transposase n=1 Tax=Actinophytocola glycyrrhizae TaxID=2044873 RepID=A0ABV9SC91_9PSEU
MVPDGLWQRIEPLLPKPVLRNPRYPGRKRIPDRQVLCGILFVLHTGIQWEFLPQELGFGSGMTCWRRLEEWNRAGVWQKLHEVLLAELHGAGKLDWSRAAIDSSHVRAARRGPKSGPSPVDRARPGSKHHVLTEGAGIPLAVSLTGGNRNDVTELETLVEAIPPVRGRRGRPRRRPDELYGDRAYGHTKYLNMLRAKGIRPRLAQRGQPHGSGLGKHRWVVERTIAWYHGMKRLRIRWERRDDIHEAFLGLATCIITWRHVTRLC